MNEIFLRFISESVTVGEKIVVKNVGIYRIMKH